MHSSLVLSGHECESELNQKSYYIRISGKEYLTYNNEGNHAFIMIKFQNELLHDSTAMKSCFQKPKTFLENS